MPVVIEDDGIELTLPNGQTVNLVERAVSVVERKNAVKRQMVLSSEAAYKQRRAEEITDKIKNNGIDETEAQRLGKEAGEIYASFDAVEIDAESLAFRFESWDVFESKADLAAGRPVPMTKEGIMKYCEKPKHAQIVADIVAALGEYDKRQGKGSAALPENSGEQSKTEALIIQ